MKRLKYILLLLLLPAFLQAQVRINEVSPKNGSVVKDDEDDYPDWLELYNTGTSTVNLQGYWLSDTPDTLNKWQFPNITIDPGGYLPLFMSGKDRPAFFDHWETAVKADDTWRYLVPSGPVPGWETVAFNDNSWAQGQGGIGYGDGDDSTIIAPAVSVYMRKSFTITDTSKIQKIIFHMDCDDGFVAYINGLEMGRYNFGGGPLDWDSAAYEVNEAQFYQNPTQEAFFEFAYVKSQFAGALIPGTNVIAVAVHNVKPTDGDLSAIPYFHCAVSDTGTYFNPTPAWFSGGEGWGHAGFELDASGLTTLFLSDPTPSAIDQIQYAAMQVDHSMGRQPDGAANVVYFGTPTPRTTNNNEVPYYGYEVDPVFSLTPGFYTGAQQLSMTTPFSNGDVHYTLDGTTPDQSSMLYAGSVPIDSTTVVKARTFSSGLLPSNVAVGTYFLDETIASTMPVVSVSTDPYLLWDFNDGIYVKGPNAEPTTPYFNANFWKRIEILVDFEYYDKQGVKQVDQQVGAKIFGNWSRSSLQKSFKFIARGKYGKNRLDYQFFDNKDLHSFKQIVLRSAGNDWSNAHMRDALMHQVSHKNTNVDIQGYQPCVMYLNGEYWGIYNIREKINEYMMADNSGTVPENIDLLEYGGSIMSGTNDDYLAMTNFIIFNDMTIQTNYDSAANWLDTDNFMDYWVVQTWANNWDWIGNNVRFWRNNKTKSKWRYILWDLDLGLGAGGWQFWYNGLNTHLNKGIFSGGWPHSFMMRSLLDNDQYRHKFINRYADLVNTALSPTKFNQLVDNFVDTLQPEMQQHYAKWGWPFTNPDWGNPSWSTYNSWISSNVPDVKNFASNRQQFARDHVQQEFILTQQVPITLDVVPSGAGKIHINTVDIEEFPWAGVYFDSVPITITAVPNPGYEFSFWQSNVFIPNPDTNLSLTIDLDTTDAFTAYFFGAPDTPVITINEINYNSHNTWDAGDWVELYNYGTWAFDLSDWRFKDSLNENSFVIPDGTIVPAGGYLVLVQDTVRFDSLYPSVTNRIGSFKFNLKVLGEKLRLMDDCLNEYISVTYSISLPWPQEPNGQGYTLELLDPWSNIDDVNNWFTGCPGGSPGGPFVPCTTSVEEKLPDGHFNLVNYPNPFTETTTIAFGLENEEVLNLTVYDIFGRSVSVLANDRMTKGKHLIQFNSTGLAAGIYYLRLTSSTFYETRVMQIN